jgi:glutaredoxin
MRFLHLLGRLWRRPGPALSHLHFTLYTRRGCHLCEQAAKDLRARQGGYQFQFEEVDVDLDPELVSRYGDWVPVVMVNGKVRFRGGVNRVLLERLFRAESGRVRKEKPG